MREVAAELFAERGYAGASMSGIARRVGIRKPSLYNYYSSKEELFLELLEGSLGAWRDAAVPGLQAPGTFRERLQCHLRATVEFAVGNPHAVALCRLAVTQIAGGFGDRVRHRLLDERMEYQRGLESFFSAAADAGEVVAAKPETLALCWLTFLDGVLFHQLFAAGDRETYYLSHLDQLWALCWRSLAPEGAPITD